MGIEQSYEKAVYWYRKAAEQGNMVAQHNLGNCYYKGEGVTQNYNEAIQWYRKAAEQGDSYAQIFLKRFYSEEKSFHYKETIPPFFLSSLDCQLCTVAMQEIIAEHQVCEIYENNNILIPSILFV